MIYHGDCRHDFAGKKLVPEPFNEQEIELYNQPGYQEH